MVRAFGVGCFIYFVYYRFFLGPSSANGTYSATLLLCFIMLKLVLRERKSCARHGKRDKVMLTLEEASQVIELLPEKFDSHDFLRQYALCFTWSYLSLLKESGDVQQLHMSIGAFLINNTSKLNISKIGEVTTANIFGKMTKCAQWSKGSKQEN